MLLFNVICIAAANLVCNSNFKELSPDGLPSKFSITGNVAVVYDNNINCLKLAPPPTGKSTMAVQGNLKLETGKHYRLTWFVKGKGSYKIYIENSKNWTNYGGSTTRPTTTKWNQGQLDFTYRCTSPRPSYLVIRNLGPDTIYIKNLKLIEAVPEKEQNPVLKIKLSKIPNLSKNQNKVNYNQKDNCLQINNKPFFPNLIWGIPGGDNLEAAMAEASNNGLNSFMAFLNHDAPRVLDLAQKYNLKVILRIEGLLKKRTNSFHNFYENMTSAVINHPALLGYFLIDEPAWCGHPFSPVLHAYRIVKTIDPCHPVWINEAPRNSSGVGTEFSKACDIFGVDIYPVGSSTHSDLPEKGLPSVGQYTRIMRNAVKDQKPIIMALQTFAWNDLKKSKKEPIYPNRHQLRFMAYDSIINGASGISWWGQEFVKRPGFYDNFFAVTRELYQMTGILSAPASAKSIACSSKKIEYLLKQTQSGPVLIAANSGKDNIKVTFTVPWKESVNVLFENRQLAGREFSDTFKPYDVHIYAIPAVKLCRISQSDYAITQPGPFRKKARQTRKQSYEGRAAWIWYPGKSYTSGFQCRFTRKIELKTIPRTAVMTFYADDYGKVNINGQNVTSKNLIAEVQKYLRKGPNDIEIIARDGGQPPGALLFDLDMTFQDGRKKNILSNNQWECCDILTGKRKPAEILYPYGSGPWKKISIEVQ